MALRSPSHIVSTLCGHHSRDLHWINTATTRAGQMLAICSKWLNSPQAPQPSTRQVKNLMEYFHSVWMCVVPTLWKLDLIQDKVHLTDTISRILNIHSWALVSIKYSAYSTETGTSAKLVHLNQDAPSELVPLAHIALNHSYPCSCLNVF